MRVSVCVFALVGLAASSAHAEEPAVDRASPAPPQERPWLYVQDASIAAPGAVTAFAGGTYASTRASVSRPFASNLVGRGFTADAGAEAGILPRLSLQATGVFGGASTSAAASAGMLAGLRLAVVDAGPGRVALSAGYLRELGADNGVWGRAAGSVDLGRLRIAGLAHVEKVFASGRDQADVLVSTGASLRLSNLVRTGVEYVVQDLEGFFDREEAEGGVRHFVGPNASIELAQRRFVITGGPAVGLSYDAPRILGRVSMSYAF